MVLAVVDQRQIQNQRVPREYVVVPVVQSKNLCDNVRKLIAVGLTSEHWILTDDQIFVSIVDMEWKLGQGLFQHLPQEGVEEEDI